MIPQPPQPRPVTIRDATAGSVVRIAGRAQLAGTPLEAPLTGRPCAAWEVVVEEFWPMHGAWAPVVRDARAVDFLLRDATGVALVTVRGGTVTLTPDTRFSSGWAPPAPRVAEFLRRYNQPPWGPMGPRSLRCLEGVILDKAKVAAIGVAEWEPDPDGATDPAGYRDSPQRLVVRSSVSAPLYVCHDL
jgi:hypothetical protein